jgi:molecular chaperone GrpE
MPGASREPGQQGDNAIRNVMSQPKKNAPEGQQQDTAASAAKREDPMTSFDPEADAQGQTAEATDGAVPAERRPRGNGSAGAAGQPGDARGKAQDGSTAAQAGESPAQAAQEVPKAGPSELEQARQEAAANFDRFLRLQAEFENYKKRVGKEHADSLRYALTPMVTELAPTLDNLERAMEHARSEPGDGLTALLAGIEMVVKQMREAFGRFGVTRIDSVGKAFDPAQHEAIAVVERADVADNQVLEEYQAGYLLHDRVIRPARVSVSKRAGDGGEKGPTHGN